MKPAEMHQIILELHAKGQSIREISRNLKISRNAVRRRLRNQVRQREETIAEDADLTLIRRLYTECKGNAIRVHEILEKEYRQEVGYSTLTRLVREARLREPKPRVGAHDFAPGVEMQHDTSPHALDLGDKRLTAQCAAIQLAYSRYTYMQYYPCWTRFEAKCFIADALSFFEGSAVECMVDNSSVLVVSGSGHDAVFAPEMEILGRIYGFEFRAHRVADPKRKGGIERFFHFAEHNFLAGRHFTDWADLNHQSLAWCHEVANGREKRKLGCSPRAAYLVERPHLRGLPRHRPPIYQALVRVVDSAGYITVDTNRYSVPDHLISKRVDVHKGAQDIRVYFSDKLVAEHPRTLPKCRGMITNPKHHRPLTYNQKHSGPPPQLTQLQGQHPLLDQYLTLSKQRIRGRGVLHFRRLLELWRTYPRDAFIAGLEQACHYGLFDLTRLENLILTHVAGDFFKLELDGDEPCY